MRDYSDWTRRLADLIVGFGANVQPGQLVGVTSYLGKEELTREIARAAYERGARYVDVLYWDHWVKRERLLLADPETLGFIPQWMRAGCRISPTSTRRASRSAALRRHVRSPGFPPTEAVPTFAVPAGDRPDRERPHDELVCRARAVPGVGRGRLSRPRPDEAYDRLWEAIAYICRLDSDDPVAAWDERMATVKQGAKALSERRFDAIRLHGPGTDLTVGLLRSSVWHAAGFTTVDGLEHFPNIPSEETFTTPDPQRVDGHVAATLPLELYGTVIKGIRVAFEGGRAVMIDADENADALRAACARDDGGSRLGELALVDGGGRIGPLGTVFFDTLIDENAASHIALGSGYALAVEDEAEKALVNESEIHIDFMIGSPELEVDGVTAAGEHVPVLRGGNWQI